tara:strand:- start:1069 stop:2067 length:999 start_codon:yes stop_codon:yes gene_type:complete
VKKLIFINFLVIITIFLVLEIIIRLSNIVGLQGYDKNAFFSDNDIIMGKPNKNFIVFGEKFKTDNNGYRIPLSKFSYQKNKNYTLILGDSVTYGVGVKEQNSFIGILRKEYKNNNLLNTAIFGHNLKSYLYILNKNNIKFKDKINNVIIFLCLNDIVPYQGVVFKDSSNQNKVKKNFVENYFKNSLTLKLNIFLREKSYLFVLVKSILTNPVERHYNYMNVLYDDQKNLIEFESHINQLINITKEKNLNPKFVLLPYAHQVKNNCAEEFLKPQNNILKIFNKLDVKLINYTQQFCAISNKNELFLPYDPVHLSEYGHKIVSDLLITDKIFIN